MFMESLLLLVARCYESLTLCNHMGMSIKHTVSECKIMEINTQGGDGFLKYTFKETSTWSPHKEPLGAMDDNTDRYVAPWFSWDKAIHCGHELWEDEYGHEWNGVWCGSGETLHCRDCGLDGT